MHVVPLRVRNSRREHVSRMHMRASELRKMVAVCVSSSWRWCWCWRWLLVCCCLCLFPPRSSLLAPRHAPCTSSQTTSALGILFNRCRWTAVFSISAQSMMHVHIYAAYRACTHAPGGGMHVCTHTAGFMLHTCIGTER
jgi:hypothetical protein